MRSLLKNKIILLLCLPVVAIALLWTIRSVFENDICALNARSGTMVVSPFEEAVFDSSRKGSEKQMISG